MAVAVDLLLGIQQQGSAASTTCEAEAISIAIALKSEALLLLGLFSKSVGQHGYA